MWPENKDRRAWGHCVRDCWVSVMYRHAQTFSQIPRRQVGAWPANEDGQVCGCGVMDGWACGMQRGQPGMLGLLAGMSQSHRGCMW